MKISANNLDRIEHAATTLGVLVVALMCLFLLMGERVR